MSNTAKRLMPPRRCKKVKQAKRCPLEEHSLEVQALLVAFQHSGSAWLQFKLLSVSLPLFLPLFSKLRPKLSAEEKEELNDWFATPPNMWECGLSSKFIRHNFAFCLELIRECYPFQADSDHFDICLQFDARECLEVLFPTHIDPNWISEWCRYKSYATCPYRCLHLLKQRGYNISEFRSSSYRMHLLDSPQSLLDAIPRLAELGLRPKVSFLLRLLERQRHEELMRLLNPVNAAQLLTKVLNSWLSCLHQPQHVLSRYHALESRYRTLGLEFDLLPRIRSVPELAPFVAMIEKRVCDTELEPVDLLHLTYCLEEPLDNIPWLHPNNRLMALLLIMHYRGGQLAGAEKYAWVLQLLQQSAAVKALLTDTGLIQEFGFSLFSNTVLMLHQLPKLGYGLDNFVAPEMYPLLNNKSGMVYTWLCTRFDSIAERREWAVDFSLQHPEFRFDVQHYLDMRMWPTTAERDHPGLRPWQQSRMRPETAQRRGHLYLWPLSDF